MEVTGPILEMTQVYGHLMTGRAAYDSDCPIAVASANHANQTDANLFDDVQLSPPPMLNTLDVIGPSQSSSIQSNEILSKRQRQLDFCLEIVNDGGADEEYSIIHSNSSTNRPSETVTSGAFEQLQQTPNAFENNSIVMDSVANDPTISTAATAIPNVSMQTPRDGRQFFATTEQQRVSNIRRDTIINTTRNASRNSSRNSNSNSSRASSCSSRISEEQERFWQLRCEFLASEREYSKSLHDMRIAAVKNESATRIALLRFESEKRIAQRNAIFEKQMVFWDVATGAAAAHRSPPHPNPSSNTTAANRPPPTPAPMPNTAAVDTAANRPPPPPAPSNPQFSIRPFAREMLAIENNEFILEEYLDSDTDTTHSYNENTHDPTYEPERDIEFDI